MSEPASKVYHGQQLSCGACGCAEHRLLQVMRSDGSVREILAVCSECGCVTHILPPAPSIRFAAGRAEEGENDNGLLCPMPWKDRAFSRSAALREAYVLVAGTLPKPPNDQPPGGK